MKKDELKRKSQNIKNLIKGVVNETVSVPDNALVFLDYTDLLEVFTKKRLELIKLIDREKPNSLQDLVKLTDRKKQAINRDLRILETHEVVKFEKKGREVIPKLNKKVIMLPLTVGDSIDKIEDTLDAHKKALKQEEPILAEIYVDGKNINQEMNAAGW